MKGNLYLILFGLLWLTACKKTISNPVSDQTPTSFDQVFEEFWHKMDANYVYWDIDTTNWNAVHSRYQPLFSRLQLNNPADAQQSVAYFRQMTDGLIDHHFTISFTSPLLEDSTVDPAMDQLRKEAGYRAPVSYIGLDERYLDSGYLSGFDNTTEPGSPLEAVSGTIGGSILFFTCNRFNLAASFHSSIHNDVQNVLTYFFNQLQHPSDLKAVLLDFRYNPGGDVSDLNFLAGRFISQPLLFGHTRYKSGNGQLDYTPWIDANITPSGGGQSFAPPIFILADRYSASVAEIITMALRALPQCQIIGETTFGATGPFAENALYDDGPFDVPGFLSAQTSSAEFRYLDGKSYEGKGFPPDYPVPFNPTALSSSDDPQMDKALSLLK